MLTRSAAWVLCCLPAISGLGLFGIRYPFDVYLTPEIYHSCTEAHSNGYHFEGVYAISQNSADSDDYRWSFIICNNTVERAGTVILYRAAGEEQFDRGWQDYADGFGDARSDYWLGLAAIRNLTEHGNTYLTVSVVDYWGARQDVRYADFRLGPAPDYPLFVGGVVDGSLPDALGMHVGAPFRAPDFADKRADGLSCVERLRSGWWFLAKDMCARVLLTGAWQPSDAICRSRKPYPICDGIYWSDWSGFLQLQSVTMELSDSL